MKKFVLAAVAASLLTTPAAFAADYRHNDNHRQVERTVVVKQTRHHTPERTVVRKQTNRDWHRGDRFDYRQARNYRQVDYRQYRSRHLYAPPRGYRWVQSGNDAVLVGITSGIIGAVLANALR